MVEARTHTGKEALRILVRDRSNHLFLRPDDAWSSAANEARVFQSYCDAFAHCAKQRITETEALIVLEGVLVKANLT